MELHLVHRNLHDEEIGEALEHQNGLTVLGFKFKVVEDDQVIKTSKPSLSLSPAGRERGAQPAHQDCGGASHRAKLKDQI